MKPYWALAEELDIPVAIHMGEGPARGTLPRFPHVPRPADEPFLLEEVLIRHPRLRVSVMHYASPLIDEMIAMLGDYPQLYVDIGGIQWFYPRPYFHEQLRRLIDAGFGKRVMFGSDQMELARDDRTCHRDRRRGPVPERGAEARYLLQQRGSLSKVEREGDREASW